MALDDVEFADNPEPRCPVLLLLDTSHSMSQDGRIEALNQGLAAFVADVRGDATAALRVEAAVVTFGSKPEIVHDFATLDDFQPPRLEPRGTTAMGAAIATGLDRLEERKRQYKAGGVLYYRPWVFLITDGAPTDSWQAAADRVRAGEADRKFLFFAVGVEGADFKTLARISPEARMPVKLKGLNFRELFQWLSASVKAVSTSDVSTGDEIPLAPVTGWGEAPTL